MPSLIIPAPKIDLKHWQAFEQITDGVMHTVAETSQRVYDQTFRAWAAWCESNGNPPTNLRPALVVAFLKSENIAKSTRQRQLSALRQLARVMSLIDQSQHPIYEALKMVKAPTGNITSERKRRSLEVDQARRLMSIFSDSAKLLDLRNRAMIALMLSTGLRRAEVVALQWKDIDLKQGILIVRHGKGDKPREVAIVCDAAIRALTHWRTEQGDRQYVFTPITKAGRILHDKPITSQTVWECVKLASKRTGIEVSPHDARRTHITELLLTQPLADVQAQAGHAHGSTTIRYAHGADAIKRRAKFKLRYGD